MKIRAVILGLFISLISISGNAECKAEDYAVERLVLFSKYQESVNLLLNQGYEFKSKESNTSRYVKYGEQRCFSKNNQEVCLKEGDNDYRLLTKILIMPSDGFSNTDISNSFLGGSLNKKDLQAVFGAPNRIHKSTDIYFLCKGSVAVTPGDRKILFMSKGDLTWLDVIELHITYNPQGKATLIDLNREFHN